MELRISKKSTINSVFGYGLHIVIVYILHNKVSIDYGDWPSPCGHPTTAITTDFKPYINNAHTMFVYFLYTSYVGVIFFSVTYLSIAVHALTILGRLHTSTVIKPEHEFCKIFMEFIFHHFDHVCYSYVMILLYTA